MESRTLQSAITVGDSFVDIENIHEQTRDNKYCETHDLIHVQNAVGQFVCPFCESNVEQ
jgi:hypothetical protein